MVKYFILFFGLTLLFACSANENDVSRAITEKMIISVPTMIRIGEEEATVAITVMNYTKQSIISKGVCWGTAINPVIENDEICETIVEDDHFEFVIDNLTRSTSYYVRAFVKGPDGVVYGENRLFTTLLFSNSLFPDPNFLKYCISKFDENKDGGIELSELKDVVRIDISNLAIGSIEGIACFKSLRFLICNDNNLSELNINKLPLLEELICQNNVLTTLNLKENIHLTKLNIARNAIKELCVDQCSELKWVDLSYTSISKFDASRNNKISFVNFEGNQLKEVNLGSNPISNLFFYSNFDTAFRFESSKIEELTIHNPNMRSFTINAEQLKILRCEGNGLTTLDLTHCAELVKLYCNSNVLEGIILQNCKKLTLLHCMKNNLSQLDLSNSPISSLMINENPLALLKLGDNDQLPELNIMGLKSSAIKLIAPQLRKVGLYGGNENTSIDLLECPELLDVGMSDCSIKSLNLSNLKKLLNVTAMRMNDLTSVNLSGCESLMTLTLDQNNISELILKGCFGLKFLSASLNKINRLDCSTLSRLKSINLSSNELNVLDCSNLHYLESLKCSGNKLSDLKLSRSAGIRLIDISDNLISNLDLSTYSQLAHLNLSKNRFTSMDLINNKNLSYLNVKNNESLQTVYLKEGAIVETIEKDITTNVVYLKESEIL